MGKASLDGQWKHGQLLVGHSSTLRLPRVSFFRVGSRLRDLETSRYCTEVRNPSAKQNIVDSHHGGPESYGLHGPLLEFAFLFLLFLYRSWGLAVGTRKSLTDSQAVRRPDAVISAANSTPRPVILLSVSLVFRCSDPVVGIRPTPLG